MNHIIRDIELCKLTGETPVGETKQLLDFFNNIFNKMVFKTHDDYPESIFMCVDNEIYFNQDLEIKTLWCRYNDFWAILERKFKYNRTDIQTIIKYMMEEHLKSMVDIPLKSMDVTPNLEIRSVYKEIKERLKSKVGKPVIGNNLVGEKMEERLKIQQLKQQIL